MTTARLKILQKIAQSTLPADLPNDTTAKVVPVTGSPPSFTATNFYPSIRIGFLNKNVPWIDGLANLLNSALYYSSAGKVHMPWMRSVNFNFGADQAPSVDLKNLMNFSKLVYNQLFTDLGQIYSKPLTAEQIAEKIRILRTSQSYLNLPTATSGQMNAKIGGDLKSKINDFFLQIK
jgi:hypothetical protein